jgi:tripartite-type tricarboxylate transporter receptor subunit TctC
MSALQEPWTDPVDPTSVAGYTSGAVHARAVEPALTLQSKQGGCSTVDPALKRARDSVPADVPTMAEAGYADLSVDESLLLPGGPPAPKKETKPMRSTS